MDGSDGADNLAHKSGSNTAIPIGRRDTKAWAGQKSAEARGFASMWPQS